MRAILFAAFAGILALPSFALAQGQARATMLVSVRVVRSVPPQVTISEPVRRPIAVVATTSPVIPIDRAAERDAERAAYRVVTINF